MSFGFQDNQPSINRAIHNCVSDEKTPITFFAAASNSGLNEPEMFPARHQCVISIRGTNSRGEFQDFNPPRGSRAGTVIGTLGLDVPAAALIDATSNKSGEVYKSGTSVATAVAAGLAALLRGYVEGQEAKGTYHIVKAKLRTQEGMLAMFESIAQESSSPGYLYIAPWALCGINDDIRWSKFEATASKVF